MFQRKMILSLILLTVVVSCKTREQIAREQMVDTLAVQVGDSQKLSADVFVRIQNLEERLSSVNGMVEESTYKNKVSTEDRFKKLEERMSVIETQNLELNKDLNQLRSESDAQKKYLEDVLSTLGKISGSSPKKTAAKGGSEYDEGMALYKKGKYKESKEILLSLYTGKKVKGNQFARVVHNLGMIEYMDKKNDQAIAYFVQLLNEHSKSSYNRNGMLVLTKTFLRLNKKDEARATSEELAKRYPGSKEAESAAKLVK